MERKILWECEVDALGLLTVIPLGFNKVRMDRALGVVDKRCTDRWALSWLLQASSSPCFDLSRLQLVPFNASISLTLKPTAIISYLNPSIYPVLGLPLFSFRGYVIFRILLSEHSPSLLWTCPNHLCLDSQFVAKTCLPAYYYSLSCAISDFVQPCKYPMGNAGTT